jgi:Zn-dependent peptidase ImmA (M78 family)
MRAKDFISESKFREHEDRLRHFTAWVCKKLNLDINDFDIKFSDKKDSLDMHHTGSYDNRDNTLWIYTGNRNLVDIMRTVAHELTHRRQDTEDRVEGVKTGPGHPLEQEADIVAGTLMKIYGKKYPEIIE